MIMFVATSVLSAVAIGLAIATVVHLWWSGKERAKDNARLAKLQDELRTLQRAGIGSDFGHLRLRCEQCDKPLIHSITRMVMRREDGSVAACLLFCDRACLNEYAKPKEGE